jgi:hypothetical protein
MTNNKSMGYRFSTLVCEPQAAWQQCPARACRSGRVGHTCWGDWSAPDQINEAINRQRKAAQMKRARTAAGSRVNLSSTLSLHLPPPPAGLPACCQRRLPDVTNKQLRGSG